MENSALDVSETWLKITKVRNNHVDLQLLFLIPMFFLYALGQNKETFALLNLAKHLFIVIVIYLACYCYFALKPPSQKSDFDLICSSMFTKFSSSLLGNFFFMLRLFGADGHHCH